MAGTQGKQGVYDPVAIPSFSCLLFPGMGMSLPSFEPKIAYSPFVDSVLLEANTLLSSGRDPPCT